ncbi:hypothetical protein ACFRQM_42980 [Streptomyces sp. NPDC056831]
MTAPVDEAWCTVRVPALRINGWLPTRTTATRDSATGVKVAAGG